MVEVEAKERGGGPNTCANHMELDIIKSFSTGKEILRQSLNYILRIAF